MLSFSVDAVLFDLDDTLIDHRGSMNAAIRGMYQRNTWVLSILALAKTLSAQPLYADTVSEAAQTPLLLPTRSVQVLEAPLPGVATVQLPRSIWIFTDFFGGRAFQGPTAGHSDYEYDVALSAYCLSSSSEMAQNLVGGYKLLPGQTLLIEYGRQEQTQMTCE